MEPQQQPVPVDALKRRQAGMDILVACCPACRQTRAVSGPGKLACPCGAHLEFRETTEGGSV